MASTDDLRKAVAANDLDAIRLIVGQDPALAMADEQPGMSIVLIARYDDREDVVEALLSGGVQVGVFEAASIGLPERMRVLLDEQPALLTAYAPDGFTPLHVAGHFCRPDVVDVLLGKGADVAAVTRSEMRVTPLHSSVAHRRGERAEMHRIVRRLLEHGTPVDAAQQGGFTALHTAARRGDVELVTMLLEFGADPGVRDERGSDAAAHARKGGHEQVIKLLPA